MGDPLQAFRVIRLILNHPINQNQKLRALARIARWQIASLAWPEKMAIPFADDTRLLVKRGMRGATGNVYSGLHDYEDMSLVIHALREQDTFVDVGANVGTYSVLAAGVAKARAIAFEPVPATYADLLDNVRVNGLEGRIQARNEGVGGERGALRFTIDRDSGNHVIADAVAHDKATTVPIVRLDDFADSVKPTVIKIDVEGYETPVLSGAERMLNSPSLLAVVMELNGSGARYGFDDAALHQRMLEHRFTPCSYSPADRTLNVLQGPNPISNTLYVREMAQLSERVRTAPRVRVLGVTI
jgi:FkbM family methyltransferase